jgi:hypothetical protein
MKGFSARALRWELSATRRLSTLLGSSVPNHEALPILHEQERPGN